MCGRQHPLASGAWMTADDSGDFLPFVVPLDRHRSVTSAVATHGFTKSCITTCSTSSSSRRTPREPRAKSAMTACPPSNRMFSGLTSRYDQPRRVQIDHLFGRAFCALSLLEDVFSVLVQLAGSYVERYRDVIARFGLERRAVGSRPSWGAAPSEGSYREGCVFMRTGRAATRRFASYTVTIRATHPCEPPCSVRPCPPGCHGCPNTRLGVSLIRHPAPQQ